MISNVRYGESEKITVCATIDGLECSGILKTLIDTRNGEIPQKIADWIEAGGVIGEPR